MASVPTAAMMMPIKEPVLRPLLAEGESGDDAEVGVEEDGEVPAKMSVEAAVGKSARGNVC